MVRLEGTMRSALWTIVLLSASLSSGQVWEKPIAPGLTYRQEVDSVRPRIINALRFSMKSPAVRMAPELAGLTVFEPKTPTSRGPVSGMVKAADAIAGVNADFFNMALGPTGNPLGLMVRKGELVALPSKRVSMAWGPTDAVIGFTKFVGSVKSEAGEIGTVDGFNEKCTGNSIVLNTTTAGAVIADLPCVSVVVKTGPVQWAPSSTVVGEVDSVGGQTPDEIKSGTVVITATGTKMASLAKLRVGDKVTISYQTQGFDWTKFENAVGGGPMLMKNGETFIDYKDEKFSASFNETSHPRTAIGKTKDGDIWLVVIDGRQPKISNGASLTELATVMANLGCTDAINLDGGGSSTMNLFGLTMNRPSDGRERSVANGVLLFGPKPDPSGDNLRIVVSRKPNADGTISATVYRDKEEVPNASVIWSAGGSAWVDQGGLIHPIGAGKCQLSAYASGQILRTEVSVTGVQKYKERVAPTDHDPDNDPMPGSKTTTTKTKKTKKAKKTSG